MKKKIRVKFNFIGKAEPRIHLENEDILDDNIRLIPPDKPKQKIRVKLNFIGKKVEPKIHNKYIPKPKAKALDSSFVLWSPKL